MYAEISARIGLEEMFSGAEVPETTTLDTILEIYDRAVEFIHDAETRRSSSALLFLSRITLGCLKV